MPALAVSKNEVMIRTGGNIEERVKREVTDFFKRKIFHPGIQG